MSLQMGQYAKAIVAALSTASSVLLTALADGAVTNAEWVTVALSVVASLGVTYVVPNEKPLPPAGPVV